MKELALITLLSLSLFGDGFQDLTGKWCADYRSANGDGRFTDCIIIQKYGASFEALSWTSVECIRRPYDEDRCNTPKSREPRVWNIPKSISTSDQKKLLEELDVKIINGQSVDVKLSSLTGGPVGEDIEFEKDKQYVSKPSFNCILAKLPREQAICASPRLSLLDQELSLTFDAAKECNPEGNLDSSQNVWWRDELSKCQTGDCVFEIYTIRIKFLRTMCN